MHPAGAPDPVRAIDRSDADGFLTVLCLVFVCRELQPVLPDEPTALAAIAVIALSASAAIFLISRCTSRSAA